MPLVLLDVADEATIEEIRRMPGVEILWIEQQTQPPVASEAPSFKQPPLLIEPLSEQAEELLKTLEELGVLRILKGRADS